MKSKTILFGATLSVLISSAAFAEDNATENAKLTTRGYVDGGLSFVYQKATTVETKADAADAKAVTAQTDVNSLKTVVGATENDGLRGTVGTLQTNVGTLRNDVDALQDTVSNLPAAKTYTGGTGITIDQNNSIGLAMPANATNGTSYVFQSDGSGGGTWTALSVEDTWDATAVARITGQQNGQAE